MPESAIEAFAGVGNPFSHGALRPGEHVVDLGSGGGFDCFVAAEQVGAEGQVVGVDMTEEMLRRSRAAAKAMGLGNVELRQGVIEDLPAMRDADWQSVGVTLAKDVGVYDRAKLRLVKCEPPRVTVWISARDSNVPFGRTRQFRLTERGLHELVAAAERIEAAS